MDTLMIYIYKPQICRMSRLMSAHLVREGRRESNVCGKRGAFARCPTVSDEQRGDSQPCGRVGHQNRPVFKVPPVRPRRTAAAPWLRADGLCCRSHRTTRDVRRARDLMVQADVKRRSRTLARSALMDARGQTSPQDPTPPNRLQ